jgi:sugar phosphate isomerase/epimerase
LTVDEFLVKAKELGYEGVMLVAKRPHVSPHDYDKAARARLKAKIDSLGLTLVGLAGYTDFTAGIDKPGIPNAEIQATWVGEIAELAKDLGTNMVRVFTGYERPDVPYDKQYAEVVSGLKMAGKLAAENGVTLAVQNHHDIALHHDAMYWLLKELNMPNVLAGWDAWSPVLEGLTLEQQRESILKMKPFIINTIVADYVTHPRFTYVNNLTNYSDRTTCNARCTSWTRHYRLQKLDEHVKRNRIPGLGGLRNVRSIGWRRFNRKPRQDSKIIFRLYETVLKFKW